MQVGYILSFVIAAICLASAIQERRDFMRCFGFLLAAALAGIIGAGILIVAKSGF